LMMPVLRTTRSILGSAEDEIEKSCAWRRGWLPQHPERELDARRYLKQAAPPSPDRASIDWPRLRRRVRCRAPPEAPDAAAKHG